MAFPNRDVRKVSGDGVMIPSPIFFALGWLVLLACVVLMWRDAQ